MAERVLVLPSVVEGNSLPSRLDEARRRSQPLPDQVARWILRIVTFALPLTFLPNLVSEFVLPKLLLLRLLLAALTILLALRWLLQGAITWRRTPLDLPLLAFVASAALSTIFAVNRNVAIFGSYDRWEGLLTIASYALLYFLTVQFLRGRSDAWPSFSPALACSAPASARSTARSAPMSRSLSRTSRGSSSPCSCRLRLPRCSAAARGRLA
jgi:hypothetical protein